jgi:hypothetical protein
MPGFSLTVIGLGEARLAAFQSLFQGKIADLNTTLQLAPLSMPAGSATAAQIVIGDPAAFDDSLPFFLCILGGGRNNGVDMETSIKEVGIPNSVSAFKNTFHTRVMLYLNPNAFPVAAQTAASVLAQAEKRERFLQRICDWVRADCLQTVAGVSLTLASVEYSAAPTYDDLCMSVIDSITLGVYEKGYAGQTQCPGAEIHITSIAQ